MSEIPSVRPISSDIKLRVPVCSQMDPQWGFEPGTERSMCGIMCLKTFADYYASTTGKIAPLVPQLLDEVNAAGGWKDSGIISHAVEVDILKGLGLIAWRRNWYAPTIDPQWFVDNEGYNSEQVAEVNAQQAAESSAASVQDNQLRSIQAALMARNPVIASVRAGFGGNTASHQIVVAGWENDEQGGSFWVMDPERPPGSPLQKTKASHFFTYFNSRAIFAKPATAL
jgi:hypothetical protein